MEVPFDVEKEFGSKKPKVKALIEGIPYRGTLVRMGSECHILGILKGIREKSGKDIGDAVRVTLEADTEERAVEVPQELLIALKEENAALAYFNSLSYTHKREYVNCILEAKREQTRVKRVEKVVEMLRQGKKGM